MQHPAPRSSASWRSRPMKKNLLSPETLRKLLRYEPETGKLFWRVRDQSFFEDGKNTATHNCAAWNRRYAETEALTAINDQGYRIGSIFNKSYRAHRVAWAMHYGTWPDQEIDHTNGNRLDNKIENLRCVSSTENSRNKAIHKNNTSGVCGVYFCKRDKKWAAVIYLSNNQKKFLGRFQSIQDAHAARKDAEKKYGFSERHGKQLTTSETAPRRM